jgi:hypothetical protein
MSASTEASAFGKGRVIGKGFSGAGFLRVMAPADRRFTE